ncbi:MAG: hypothetical protein JNJ77_21690 [Planctomycetia bacterium]|nr:hypothetical protein [Planctomycetia bacterium]
MWKLLRWILLVILPMLGLFAGWKLLPVQKPVWTYQAEYVVKPLGYVNNDSTLLVAEVTSQGKQSLFGLEPETGVEQFRIPITRELLDASAAQIRECVLSDNERYVVFPASHYDEKKSKEKQVILFDWKAGKVEKRFWVERMVDNVFLKNNTLVARDYQQITVWKLDKTVDPIRIKWQRTNELYFNVNPDARIAYRCCVDPSGRNKAQLVTQLQLYDIKNEEHLPEIEGYVSDLEWSSDGQSFSALRSNFTNPVGNKLTVQYFVRTDYGFQEVPEKEVSLSSSGFNHLADKDFRLIHSASKFDRRRVWLKKQLGATFANVVDKCWPEADSLLLFDRKTNQLHGSISGLEGKKSSAIRYAFSLPEKNGLVIGNERYFDYWNYNPISNWYPLFGLCAGVLFSALLMWLTKRKRTPNLSLAQHS